MNSDFSKNFKKGGRIPDNYEANVEQVAVEFTEEPEKYSEKAAKYALPRNERNSLEITH